MGFDWTNRLSFREYSILCISKIWVDWPGIGLPIYPRLCFGPTEPGLCFGLLWRGVGAAWSPPLFWAGEWNTGPISLSPSISINFLSCDGRSPIEGWFGYIEDGIRFGEKTGASG